MAVRVADRQAAGLQYPLQHVPVRRLLPASITRRSSTRSSTAIPSTASSSTGSASPNATTAASIMASATARNARRASDAFSDGKPLPDGPRSPTYPEWLQFSSQVIKTLTSKIANHIMTRRPDAGLVLGAARRSSTTRRTMPSAANSGTTTRREWSAPT